MKKQAIKEKTWLTKQISLAYNYIKGELPRHSNKYANY